MITTRLKLHRRPRDAVDQWSQPFRRLIVIDWICAAEARPVRFEEYYPSAGTATERVDQTWAIDITWAPTATTETIGYTATETEATAIVAELETLLEMAGPLS